MKNNGDENSWALQQRRTKSYQVEIWHRHHCRSDVTATQKPNKQKMREVDPLPSASRPKETVIHGEEFIWATSISSLEMSTIF